MGLTIVTGHRLEALFDALLATLRDAPSDPMATETIVVPGQGVARWLELRLAERLGIAAGLSMPFLGAWLHRLCAPDPAATAEADPFQREVLLWRLWRLCGTGDKAFGPATDYCRDDPDGQKRLQLCRRIAACFDDYQLYRDDLLAAFAAGDDQARLSPHAPWQAALWRALLRDAGHALPQRRPARAKRAEATPFLFAELADDAPLPPSDESARRLAFLRRRIDDPAWCARHLPPRLSVFGVSTMPPAFLSLLQAMAQRVPVQLYVPQPTPHYVGDLRARSSRSGENALLARFGAESREFQDRLAELENAADPDDPPLRFDLDDLAATIDATAAPRDLLHCVQADIVAAFDRSEPGAQRFRLAGDDPSLRVHDCHGPQRELEVVRDQICRAMSDDLSLQPRDFLVLVPDIDRYAPYAEAVFGPLQQQLPFHVADRHPARELPICRALLLTLDLVRARLTIADVLHLLETPAVQRRFALFASDVPQLRHLCQKAGVRWGLDAESRAERYAVPAFADNSWQQGLERLLLGSLTGPLDRLVLDRAPVGDVTESRAELLQRFLGFVRTLFAQLEDLDRARPLPQWADLVDQLVQTLFAAETSGPGSSDDADALRQLQRATVALRAQARAAQLDEPVRLEVLRAWLDDTLGQGAPSRGFLGGSITVAAMLPMRAVPVRCLYLCGLDDASFPRRDHPAPFDLMAQVPRRGDRNRRLDDRQLFLDLVLAARDRLHLTFVGHSAKDNAEGAPSVVLAELLDHLDRTCTTSDGRTARQHVVVHHPLQPWSPRYHGDDPRLFTWQAVPAFTPNERRAGNAPWCPPKTDLLPAGIDDDEAIALDDLLTFWWNPSRAFLRESLRLRVRGSDDAEQEDEPFLIDALGRYQLQDDAVQRVRRGDAAHDAPLRRARAAGVLPVGAAGDVALHHIRADSEELERQAHLLAGARTRRIDVRLRDADGRPAQVHGELDGFTVDASIYLRVSKLKAKDRLRAWLRHLLVAVQRQQPERSDDAPWPTSTLLFAGDGARRYDALSDDDALRHLGTLVAWYRRGLRRPLEFFEHASFAAAEVLGERGDAEAALRAAHKVFVINEEKSWLCDQADVDVALCTRDRDPFGEHRTGELTMLADLLWLPALTALREEVE